MKTFLKKLLLVVPFAIVGSVQAQNYPNQALRMIVPFPVGGGADLAARASSPPTSRRCSARRWWW